MNLVYSLVTLLNLFTFTSNFTETTIIEKPNAEITPVSNEYYIVNSEDEIYLYSEANKFLLNKEIEGSIETNKYIYMYEHELAGANIYVFDKNTNKLTEHYLENIFISNIYEYNQQLYLCGKINDDGLVLVLDEKLNIVNERIFKSDGHIVVNNLIITLDSYYLSIYKDGITNNSEFINHGNQDEIKSILVHTDKDFNVKNVMYFNNNCKSEIVKDCYIKDDKIYLLIQTETKYILYVLTKEFEIIDLVKIDANNDYHLLINYKNDYEYLLLDQTTMSLAILKDKMIEKVYDFNQIDNIDTFRIFNGVLYLYGNINNTAVVKQIKEYEINYINDKIVNRLNLDTTSINHFKVTSYFEEFDFKLDSITPYFEVTNCGTYVAAYKAITKNNEEIIIETNLIVEPYTNFIDGGIYATNKVLEFFGNATLNGEPIYYGATLSELGEYTIKIENAQKEEYIYNITIVDNYYLEEVVYNINSDITCVNEAFVNLNIGACEVVELVIDDLEYFDYTYCDDVLTIRFLYEEKRVVSHKINYIKVKQNNYEYTVNIDKTIIIKYLKESPKLNLTQTLENNSIMTTCQLEDYNQTFVCLKVVTNKELYQITKTKEINILPNETVKIYFSYTLGDDKIEDVLIGEYIQNANQKIDIDLNYELGKLEKFTINYEIINKDNLNIDIDSTSYEEFYCKIDEQNYLEIIIIISIGIIILSTFIFIGYLGFKKMVKKMF